MGLFNNLLDDITSGELDKKLGKLADDMEKVASKMGDSAEHLARKSEHVLQKAGRAGQSQVVDVVKEEDLPHS